MSRKNAPDPVGALTPPAAAVARFRRDLEATGATPEPARRLAVAVSGGPDSIALLLLAASACPDAVIAATVDHGLRAGSAEEAAAVARTCAAIGVPHVTLNVAVGAGNLQAEARAARYAALADWARDEALWLATAHQRDDIAETFLMRARRGAGVGGLAAMRSARRLGAVRLIRPLLGWSRAELEPIATLAGYTRDPSNTAPRFDRARIRALLAATPELPPSRLALAATNLRDAEDAIGWMTGLLVAERVRSEGAAVFVRPHDLPRELRRRLALFAIEAVRKASGISGEWRITGLDRLLATLDSGRTGTIAGVKAAAKRSEWRFEAAPARRSA